MPYLTPFNDGVDIMVDIETLGTGNNPVMVQICAVQFDIKTFELGDTFSVNIDLESAMDYGTVGAGAIKFWLTDKSVSQQARDVVFNKKDTVHFEEAMEMFNDWLKRTKAEYLHGNGAASDNVWLRSGWEAAGTQDLHLSFREDFCLRTMKTLAKRCGWVDNVIRTGIYHNGLDDAVHQVKVFEDIVKYLNLDIK